MEYGLHEVRQLEGVETTSRELRRHIPREHNRARLGVAVPRAAPAIAAVPLPGDPFSRLVRPCRREYTEALPSSARAGGFECVAVNVISLLLYHTVQVHGCWLPPSADSVSTSIGRQPVSQGVSRHNLHLVSLVAVRPWNRLAVKQLRRSRGTARWPRTTGRGRAPIQGKGGLAAKGWTSHERGQTD